jgi:plasmid stabilization system protein ParE
MPPDKTIVWSPESKKDLRQIWHYYSRVASPEVADRVVREIAAESERIGRYPIPGREHDEFPGLRRLLIHPYTLFFRITGDAAEVARVLHEQRDFFSVLGSEAH